MVNRIIGTILVIIAFSTFTIEVNAQIRNYVYGGMEMEMYQDFSPVKLILDDYNTYHASTDVSTLHSFAIPQYIQGFSIGAKIHSRFSMVGGNVHFNQFVTVSEGQNEMGGNYYEKLNISHNGFLLHYHVTLINTNFFRTGPGVGAKIEQYRFKLNEEKDSDFNTFIPVNKAIISGQLNYTISIGGPKFNIDLVGFYNIPINSLNLTPLNDELNEDHTSLFTDEQMLFKANSYGVMVRVCIGSRDNYDY